MQLLAAIHNSFLMHFRRSCSSSHLLAGPSRSHHVNQKQGESSKVQILALKAYLQGAGFQLHLLKVANAPIPTKKGTNLSALHWLTLLQTVRSVWWNCLQQAQPLPLPLSNKKRNYTLMCSYSIKNCTITYCCNYRTQVLLPLLQYNILLQQTSCMSKSIHNLDLASRTHQQRTRSSCLPSRCNTPPFINRNNDNPKHRRRSTNCSNVSGRW